MIGAVQAPHIEEQRNDVNALQEGLAAARKLSPKHLTDLIDWQRKESDDYNKRLRNDWSYWWDLWLNQIDFGDKEEWQTQIWVPKPFTAAEQASSLIQRSLLDTPEPFGIEGTDDRSKPLALHVWNPIVRMAFEQANFIGKFADAAKVGFITGVAGYLKLRWQRTAIPVLTGATMDPTTGTILPAFRYTTRSFLAIDYVPPWNIYRDPYSRARENFSGAYLIHEEHKGRPDVWALVKAAQGQPIVDGAAVQKLLARRQGGRISTEGQTETQQKEAARKQQTHQPSPVRLPYLFREWWGDVLNEHGDPVFPDAMMTSADGELVVPPISSPVWATDIQSGRRKWPFIATAPIVHPTRFEGRGICEQNADLSRLFSGTFCLAADGMNWMVNGATEVWQDALADWNDLAHYPGKLWVKKDYRPALMAAQVGKMEFQSVLAFLQYVGQLAKESDFVTDFAAGLPGSRSAITKGEVEIKTGQSLAVFEMMSKNLEHGGREAVELAKDLIAQHLTDFTAPELAATIGERNAMLLMQLPIEERIAELQGNFKYTFTGVTQAMRKADQINKIVQFGQLAGSIPYVQLIAQQSPVAFLQILQTLRDLLGLGDRITLPDEAQVPGAAGPQGMAPGMAPGGPGMAPGAPGGGAPDTVEALMRAYETNAAAAGMAGRGPQGTEGGM